MRCFAKPGSSKFELPRFKEAQIGSSSFELPEFSCRWLEILIFHVLFQVLSNALASCSHAQVVLDHACQFSSKKFQEQPCSSSESTGSSLPKATKTEVVPAAITCLRSAFPQGFKESMFNGTEDEIGEMHCAFLQKWYRLKCGADDSRKAFKRAFPAWAMLW